MTNLKTIILCQFWKIFKKRLTNKNNYGFININQIKKERR